MHYIVIAKDIEDSGGLRSATLPEHRGYVDAHANIIVVSGPLLADDSDLRIGQFFLLEVDSRNDAESFVAADPFTRAGIFDEVLVSRIETKFELGRRI